MNAAEPVVLERFVVLEGVDGAGTTTQLARIDAALTRSGIAHWTTCEPTKRPEGRLIRSILGGELQASPGTLAHLFAADRYEHLHGSGGILERLGRGEVVVCDRYLFSSLAYQAVACESELPYELNKRFPLPQLLFYFDVDPELSMARLEGRESREIYEKLPFQARVRAAYEDALLPFREGPMRLVRVDAGAALLEVERIVLRALGEALDVALDPE